MEGEEAIQIMLKNQETGWAFEVVLNSLVETKLSAVKTNQSQLISPPTQVEQLLSR